MQELAMFQGRDRLCHLQVCSNVLRVGTMAARCDAARLVYPGSIAAPLILGTIGGSGGKFLSDAILAGAGLAQGMRTRTSSGVLIFSISIFRGKRTRTFSSAACL